MRRCLMIAAGIACGCMWGMQPACCAGDGAPEHWRLQFDFEGDELPAGWYTTAGEAELSIAREPELVRKGRGALQLSYTPVTGKLALVGVKELATGGLPRSLSFSLKTQEPTPVMFGVQEADGSRYEGYCYSAGGRWYDIATDLDELMLVTGCADENGRLDPCDIVSIMVTDLSNLPGEVGESLGIKNGPQRLWLDDVCISTDLAPHRSSRTPEGNVIIDDLERDPPPCLPIGAPVLSITADPDNSDRGAMRVDYSTGGYRWVGFVLGVGHLNLSGQTDLRLTVRADNQARLTVVLEERDGSKYTAHASLDPGRGWYTLKLPLERFKLDTATVDENAALDLDQIRVIIPVLDTKRAEVDEAGRGSYTISRIWCGRPEE